MSRAQILVKFPGFAASWFQSRELTLRSPFVTLKVFLSLACLSGERGPLQCHGELWEKTEGKRTNDGGTEVFPGDEEN